MRVCECGCGESLEGRDVRACYASDACRVRAWDAQHPRTAQEPREVRSNGHSRSGLQVSYRKAVDMLAVALWNSDERYPYYEDAVREAKRRVRRALSDKQRARLDARDADTSRS